MNWNKRPRGGGAVRRSRLRSRAAAIMAAGSLAATVGAGQPDGPIDSYATAGETIAPAAEILFLPIDSFAAGSEYLPFPRAEVPFDVWALPGDRSLFLPLAPEGESGTFDALAVRGDELERYARASTFVGGFGAGDKRCVILMYHRFRPVPSNKYEVSFSSFHAQLDYIARHGYEVIPVDQLVEALHRNDPDLLPPRSVVITIDDGYRCAHDFAWPLLAEYEYPFALYLYTNYVGTGGNSMTWGEIRDLASDDLVTVGAHSISHSNLANPRKARGPYESWVARELTYPKHRIEAETGKPVRTFCWPYGSYNSYGVSAAIRAGYEGLLTVNAGANSMDSSPYHLRRYGVYWHTPMSLFARMLEGRPVTDDMWDRDASSTDFLIP